MLLLFSGFRTNPRSALSVCVGRQPVAPFGFEGSALKVFVCCDCIEQAHTRQATRTLGRARSALQGESHRFTPFLSDASIVPFVGDTGTTARQAECRPTRNAVRITPWPLLRSVSPSSQPFLDLHLISAAAFCLCFCSLQVWASTAQPDRPRKPTALRVRLAEFCLSCASSLLSHRCPWACRLLSLVPNATRMALTRC